MDEKLAALWADWEKRPFQWGAADCTTFARDAVFRVHGIVVDCPVYINERDALRLLSDHFRGWCLALRNAGFELVGSLPGVARRGDLVLYESEAPGLFPNGLAVCFGGKAYCPGESGLAEIPPAQWRQVWSPKAVK